MDKPLMFIVIYQARENKVGSIHGGYNFLSIIFISWRSNKIIDLILLSFLLKNGVSGLKQSVKLINR